MNDCCDRSPSERAYTAWYNANSRGERETLDARAEVVT